MKLTPEQQAILDGERGEVPAKVMKTLVMYGETFGAETMVPVTGRLGHTVISFGINAMKPVYDLYDRLLEAGMEFRQPFTADPLPLDRNVPSNLLQDLVFRQFMYKQQGRYEDQLRRMGMTSDRDFTCACYFDQVGNIPEKGDVLSWGGVLRGELRQQRAGRPVQPQLRHHRCVWIGGGVCALLRPAHRRGAAGVLGGGGAYHPPA